MPNIIIIFLIKTLSMKVIRKKLYKKMGGGGYYLLFEKKYPSK